MIRVSFVLQVTAKIARLDCDDGSQGALESGRYFAGIIAITSPVTGSTFLTDGAAPSDPYFLFIARSYSAADVFLYFPHSASELPFFFLRRVVFWKIFAERKGHSPLSMAATGVAMNRDSLLAKIIGVNGLEAL